MELGNVKIRACVALFKNPEVKMMMMMKKRGRVFYSLLENQDPSRHLLLCKKTPGASSDAKTTFQHEYNCIKYLHGGLRERTACWEHLLPSPILNVAVIVIV
ncbi:unnamed protein product [Ophioblennius macclurei]